ncbi:transglycosylase SLT domain-containing protein [Chelatococcus sambhunathii]|uniref:Transglycosylase SLT domain-containing protein n=1 Tax=Chelatococcus sambhunathii TaxID=363953 RepID=A0ABU1DEZ9_9HYPH|nr:transglycosylase SLT domain-containing protein [Chelatococcus sambhunathii]MDR4306625.1 transglycosylase SLT domain-containing protein [Chelatococcus sambhunathii]
MAAVAVLSGCGPRTGPTPQADAAPPPRETPPSSGSASSGSAPLSCTAQWRAHGHTTQTAAKAFAAQCLRDQGGVARQLNAASVAVLARQAVPTGSGLTALEPSDIEVFCPAYRRQGAEGRAAFWAGLLTAIARPESDYNTATTLWEGGTQQQFSIGLLQLSLSDEGGYRCGFRTEADITEPARNLACGEKILLKLVSRAGFIGGDTAHQTSAAAAYWSTLRSSSPARAEIIGKTRALEACRG